jgi:hypothetical protein
MMGKAASKKSFFFPIFHFSLLPSFGIQTKSCPSAIRSLEQGEPVAVEVAHSFFPAFPSLGQTLK